MSQVCKCLILTLLMWASQDLWQTEAVRRRQSINDIKIANLELKDFRDR